MRTGWAGRIGLALAACGCALVTAACGSADGSAPPTFRPSPEGGASEVPGVTINPIIPEQPGQQDGAPGSGSGGRSGPASRSPSPSQRPQADPNVVATKLRAPVGLTLLPDGTALVGERTTGRIVRVQPTAGRPTPVVKTISGLDTAGGGGLLDLAVSPEYAQDNLIYAYISTRTDNRVVDFTLGGPVTPVLTGIPHGASGNAGRIDFDAAGSLYVGTGLAGSPGAATNPASLAGKVLRVDAIGNPAKTNPRPGSPVFTSGHDGVAGLCPIDSSLAVLEVETGAPRGEINALSPGASYGYPSAGSGARRPVGSLPTSMPGDCAVQSGRLWITSPDGRALLNTPLTAGPSSVSVGKFGQVLANRYGRLLTVVAAPDGALWLTTTNRDGKGKPVAADERVIRYLPSRGGGGSGSPF